MAAAWTNLWTEVPDEVAQAREAEARAVISAPGSRNGITLIRGSDGALRERYLAAFNAQDQAVQQRVQALATTIADPGAATLARDFATAHAAMRARYLDAMEGFAASGDDTHATDLSVRGVDRAPSGPSTP